MPSAFISYRRDDSGPVVVRIEAALRGAFDNLDVFLDTGGIQPGEDFLQVLQYHVEQDLIFLAVIGPQWRGESTGKFASRLHDPDDMVRREIEWRLRNWRSDIITVLVNGAEMPRASELPEDMAGLTRLNALTVPQADFATGVAMLTRRIDQILSDTAIASRLDQLEAAVQEETASDPPPREPPAPGVPAFQLAGKWSCDVQSSVPDSFTGPLGHMVITFEVAADKSMSGSIAWPGRKEGGRVVAPEPIEGEAMLFKERHATLYGGDRFDRLWLQGVVGRAQSLTIEIPVHTKLGKVYHGSDPQGRQYALRLLKATGARFGF